MLRCASYTKSLLRVISVKTRKTKPEPLRDAFTSHGYGNSFFRGYFDSSCRARAMPGFLHAKGEEYTNAARGIGARQGAFCDDVKELTRETESSVPTKGRTMRKIIDLAVPHTTKVVTRKKNPAATAAAAVLFLAAGTRHNNQLLGVFFPASFASNKRRANLVAWLVRASNLAQRRLGVSPFTVAAEGSHPSASL